MHNPYVDRVLARMRQAGAFDAFKRHWSFRLERGLHRVGYRLESISPAMADVYTSAARPVCDWLGRRQAAYLRQWM